jgi:formylglycine-generating enzyme required for sulfatase activity
VNVFDTWRATHPVAGEGAHPRLGPTSGWPSQNAQLAATAAVLKDNMHIKCATDTTWTDAPSNLEEDPMICVSWYEAFAFCIWDGGYLPTEAEWEMAAAGGAQNRLFPWGVDPPDTGRANFAGGDFSPFVPVGTYRDLGHARWNHDDLAGNAYEWVLDWYGSYSSAVCNNCASLAAGNFRVLRGGSWGSQAADLRVAGRYFGSAAGHDHNSGWRCARKP